MTIRAIHDDKSDRARSHFANLTNVHGTRCWWDFFFVLLTLLIPDTHTPFCILGLFNALVGGFRTGWHGSG